MINAIALESVTPTEEETTLARESSRRLSQYGPRDLAVQVDGVGEVVLPASAVQLLVRLLTEMGEGNAITLVPIHAELTTQQAADLIDVSRPFLIKQMEEGLIPFHNVGTHRRILFKDLMEYKRKMIALRLEALDELAALGQEMDPNY